MQSQATPLSFFARLKLAMRVLSDGSFARQASLAGEAPAATAAIEKPAAPPRPTPAAPAVHDHSSGLAVLGLLQREARLIDFLQEDVTSFSDADIGAAARVVHAGARKVLSQYLTLEPILPNAEGDAVTLKTGYDAQRIRLTGNVTGQPPFRGTLRHHGWYASDVRFPTLAATMDPKVIAPAEVEL
jgi:hypothetical protein